MAIAAVPGPEGAGRPAAVLRDLRGEMRRRRSFDEAVIEAERARAADEALAAAGLPVPRPRPPRLRAVT